MWEDQRRGREVRGHSLSDQDPGVQTLRTSSVRPRVQTPRASSLRPRSPDPQNLLHQTQGPDPQPLLPQTQEPGPPVRPPSDPGVRAPSSLFLESLESGAHSLCSLRPRRVLLPPTQLPFLPLSSEVWTSVRQRTGPKRQSRMTLAIPTAMLWA